MKHLNFIAAQFLCLFGLSLLLATPAFAQSSTVERYIIKYKTGSKFSVATEINQAGGEIVLGVDRYSLFAAEMLPADKDKLSASADIEYIEIDPKRYIMAETVPYGIPMVEADLVAETLLTPRKICIIDTGFDYTHPDLQSLRLTGDNQVQFTTVNNVVYYTINTGPWWIDENGHGTAMGGIIAGLGNTIGIKGVNPGDNLSLHIVKPFQSPNGIGTMSFWTYGSRTIHALGQCLDAGADIVNMSYGGPVFSQSENNAVIAAANSNVLLVGAAGNFNPLTSWGVQSDPRFPAGLDAVISVASVDSLEVVASDSHYANSTDLAAPGVAVNSTALNHGYSVGSGTSNSAATPVT